MALGERGGQGYLQAPCSYFFPEAAVTSFATSALKTFWVPNASPAFSELCWSKNTNNDFCGVRECFMLIEKRVEKMTNAYILPYLSFFTTFDCSLVLSQSPLRSLGFPFLYLAYPLNECISFFLCSQGVSCTGPTQENFLY